MSVEKWSETVRIVHLGDDPQFSEDLLSLDPLPAKCDVVLDFGAVRFVNSSNIAKLLTIRKKVVSGDGKLILCNVKKPVLSAFVVTGLDKIFEYGADVSTALAALQMNATSRR